MPCGWGCFMGKWMFFRHIFALFALVVTLAGCSSLSTIKSDEPEKYVLAPSANEARHFFTRSGLHLFGQWWMPSGSPKAIVLLVHGTAVHSGFYDPWAKDLTSRGYAVFGIDLRGWGQSQGYGARRGSVGKIDEYVEDVEIARREVRRRFPGKPVYLQGESLGGAVVLMASISGRVASDGLILNAPAIQLNPGHILPASVGNFGLWTAAQSARHMAQTPLLPVWKSLTWTIVKDPAVKQRYWEDPFTAHKALPGSFLVAMQDVTQRLQLNINNVRVPFLVMHGTRDALVAKEGSELLMAKAVSTDKTIKIYEGMRHATLHDVDKDKVWSDVTSWLDTHADKAIAAKALNPDPTEISDSGEDDDSQKTAFRSRYQQLTMTTRN
ncbi:acylglycerol lipase [Fluviicoccus keumensis]|uniref:Acylglycerol lipase n=2 Tax=Fluviicoccus keumensis TaxID=1435465 RepID=A0A4Q7ZCT0_9GAMM|nr:acylglycerol lipase [Fluviicoccus keumensis]